MGDNPHQPPPFAYRPISYRASSRSANESLLVLGSPTSTSFVSPSFAAYHFFFIFYQPESLVLRAALLSSQTKRRPRTDKHPHNPAQRMAIHYSEAPPADQQTTPAAAAAAASSDDAGLFSLDLVSPDIAAQLPDGYRVRSLRKSDYDSGYLDCLRVLTTVGDFDRDAWHARYDEFAAAKGTYYILVVEDGEGRVVGTGGLIVERKIVHNLGSVGHIEDIAVAKDQQGKKLGLRIIQALDYISERVGCYKSILDCSEKNEGFYIKCGFKRAGLQMAHYYEDGKSKAT
ncbi:hypothetical protein RB600_001651 [Gaeumannomyces tritici]